MLASPRPVVTAAQRTLDTIIQAYLGPNRTLHGVLEEVHRGGFHFFTEFGEACRKDLGRGKSAAYRSGAPRVVRI